MPTRPPSPKEPGEHLIEQIEAFAPLAKAIGLFSPSLGKQFAEIEAQLAAVKASQQHRQRFAEVYAPLGWTVYDRISLDLLAEVVALPGAEGEARLTEHHLHADTLNFLGYRFYTAAYSPWEPIYERAVERALAGDFLSAVPLVLIIIDGLCTTTTQKHPFSGGADAPVFDTITAGPGGIADGL